MIANSTSKPASVPVSQATPQSASQTASQSKAVAEATSAHSSAKGTPTMATPTNASSTRPGSVPARGSAAIEDKPRAAASTPQAKIDAAKAEQQKGKLAAIGRAAKTGVPIVGEERTAQRFGFVRIFLAGAGRNQDRALFGEPA